MSVSSPPLYHPVNNAPEQVWEGWSWPAFFVTGIWVLVKEMWGHAAIVWLVCIFTAGWAAPIIWIVYGANGNRWHRERLLSMGYLTQAQFEQKQADAKQLRATTAPPASPAPQVDVVERLSGLARLKEQGHLTEDEFAAQKRLLLG